MFFCKPKRDKQVFEGQTSWNGRRVLHSSDGQACPRANRPVPIPVNQWSGGNATDPELGLFQRLRLCGQVFCFNSSGPLHDPGESYDLSPEDASQTYLQNFAHIPSPCMTLPQVLGNRNLHQKVLDHFLKPLWHIVKNRIMLPLLKGIQMQS